MGSWYYYSVSLETSSSPFTNIISFSQCSIGVRQENSELLA